VQYALAIVLVIHGVAHLVGFVVPWRLARLEEMPFGTTLLGGRIDVGDRGIRAVGILWLVAALAYLAAAVGVALLLPWWIPAVATVTVFSLALCVLGWPDSRIGVAVDLAILAFLMAGGALGWLPTEG
jgi:hypothetical protein